MLHPKLSNLEAIRLDLIGFEDAHEMAASHMADAKHLRMKFFAAKLQSARQMTHGLHSALIPRRPDEVAELENLDIGQRKTLPDGYHPLDFELNGARSWQRREFINGLALSAGVKQALHAA